ncbi:CPBP family intramembrane metalloprotease [Labilibacter sediminis]|nr:CPBP family intramembrane metalloprotease [Labilibacter sediminis]
MLTPFFNNIRPSQQLILLIIITLSSWILFSLIGTVLGALLFDINIFSDPSEILSNTPFLKYFQTIQSIGLFIFPPFLFTWLTQSNTNKWLLIKQQSSFWYILIAIAVVFISQPAISYLGIFNNGIVFPEYLESLGEWMRNKETEALHMTEIFLHSSTRIQTVVNVIIIAVLPAIGEELLFRGALQRIFFNLFKNTHLAIIITAVLFSAMHIQFFGFLPRLVLGLIFGYLVVYSGNIWMGIAAHFTNNFMAYVLYQQFVNNPESINPLDLDQGQPDLMIALLSTIGVVALLILLKHLTKNKTNPYLSVTNNG